MRRKATIALGVAVLVFVVSAAACGGDDDDGSAGGGTTTEETGGGSGSGGDTLQGTTGPGFTITVTQDGQAVDSLTSGTYTITVKDESEMHNFHLMGPGVDEEITDVPFVGEKSLTVTFQPGTYTYQCDPHAAQMNGTFDVA
jgi:hypothetical protein